VWDPAIYLEFADERARPFGDLLVQVLADSPEQVADLGCGPGQLTASLADRWPEAAVLGIDSSSEMIARAQPYAHSHLRFEVQDLRDWRPAEPVDVIVSNATLQWVPGHRQLLTRLVDALAPDGWLAFQVPGNFGEPSHELLHELADDARFSSFTAGRERPDGYDAATYLDDLAGLGCAVNAWETTYLHVLSGPDPVFRWISGTGARPVLQALPADLREEFTAEYKRRLVAAYPERPYGTLLPFRRVFVVAHRSAAG
jgi:trans-aconitate 2-methyltransferase